MKTKAINSFSGTRVSGLLKEVFNRLDNGGLNQIHLELLLNHKNPYDPILYAWWEWKIFYREFFNIGIEENAYEFPVSYISEGIVLVTTRPRDMDFKKLKGAWESRFPVRPIHIENSYAEEGNLDISLHESPPQIKQFVLEKVSDTHQRQILRGMVDVSLMSGRMTVEEALLLAIFLSWKNGNPMIKKFGRIIEGYTIPCIASRYEHQPVTEATTYALVTICWAKYQISIYPSLEGAGHGYNPIIDFVEQK